MTTYIMVFLLGLTVGQWLMAWGLAWVMVKSTQPDEN